MTTQLLTWVTNTSVLTIRTNIRLQEIEIFADTVRRLVESQLHLSQVPGLLSCGIVSSPAFEYKDDIILNWTIFF